MMALRLSELGSAADLEVECTARAVAKLREHGAIDPDTMTELERAVFGAGVAAGVAVLLDMIREDNG
jgi:hypothetical protein